MTPVRLAASLAAASVLISATALAQVDPKKTERTWKSKCASCHGTTGKGDTEKGQQLKIVDMTTPAFQAKKDDELKKAINDGVEKEKSHAFKSELTAEQVDALVAYIRGFKK
jgi:mono/diheme cytochrome c family protein